MRKYRHIALRGPWTSGGIELNFGIVGHTPATATPVDYLYRKNPDGSVSCFVGAMDLPSRTQWRVEFVLPPDKAYFESRALWYNPQPLNQSYYVWMNAANKLGQDLEFIFPGTKYIGHNYDVPERPWPMKGERNLALYKDHDDSDEGSFFIHGAFNDFSGGYWHDSQFGYGHWAMHEDVPGQKFFRWPLSGAGAIWETLLTDNDGPYFEPQNGRLLDQNDHEFFAPYTTDQWSEVWFPYKKIGPMVKATPYGALNARNTGGAITLAFCALQNIDENIVVRAAGKEIFRERLVLKPMEVWEKSVPAAVKKGDSARRDRGQAVLHGRPRRRTPEAAAELPQLRREHAGGALPERRARGEGPQLRTGAPEVPGVPQARAAARPRPDARGRALLPAGGVPEGARITPPRRSTTSCTTRTPTTSTASSPAGSATWSTPRRRSGGPRGR